ncbi:hypothetical protein ACE1TH_03410 [Shouchella sp. JSM 1781072]|uniref:hypothetical protein n=1 Tax=Bacillaceae TaxID=186817 RepID=UPI000C085311|nr:MULTISPECIES: hypothetical protein [Bacillaceae]UTR04943.1 hypothetical protein MM326_12480 [Alkalihalobacillus sp. LMS6]
MIPVLFLSLPIIAVALMYGFHDMRWHEHKKPYAVPFSLGAFILYAYLALSSLLVGRHFFFSYIAMGYMMVSWALGFYLDVSQKKFYLKTVKQAILKNGVIVSYLLALGFFSYLLASGEGKSFFIVSLLFLVFPISAYFANKVPYRLMMYFIVLAVIGCFFIVTPTFIDVLYLLTIIYIAIVLEVEDQASYGFNGSFVLGAIIAFWAVAVPEEPVQIMFLILGLAGLTVFIFWPLMKIAIGKWLKQTDIAK